MEMRVSAVILNVYQSTGIEKEDGSRQSLESHRKLDEIRRFYNKKFEEKHDVHRNLASSGEYLKPNKKGEYQYVSGVMGRRTTLSWTRKPEALTETTRWRSY